MKFFYIASAFTFMAVFFNYLMYILVSIIVDAVREVSIGICAHISHSRSFLNELF